MAGKSPLICLLLLGWLAPPVTPSVKCNQNLLATFKLRGLEYSVNDRMQVCPHVDNRCCSLMDEVRIVQLWHQYGGQQVRMFSGKVVQLFISFYKLHDVFKRIKLRDMVFHYLSFNRLRWRGQACSDNTHVQRLRRWTKFMEMQRMFPGWGPVRRFGKSNRFSHLVRLLTNMLIHEADEDTGLLPSERLLKLKDPKHRKQATRKARKQLKDFMESPMKRFLKAQTDFSAYSQKFQAKSEQSNRVIHHLPRALHKTKKTKKMAKKAPTESGTPKASKKGERRLGRQRHNIIIFVPTGSSFLDRFRFFTRMRVPFIPVNREVPMINCRSVRRSFFKPYLVLNEDKYRFCHRALSRLKQFDPRTVEANFENVKATLASILELKKSLYCSICDGTQQYLIDTNRGLVLYSQEFCLDLLTKYKDYIMFKNIDFVEFVDNLLQVQECAQSTGDETTFPKVNRFSWMKRRIPFIRRCYENLDRPDFYIYCRFMCVQYRIQDYSNFFEGDLRTMERVYGSTMSFVRARQLKGNFDNEPHELRVASDSVVAANVTGTALDKANLDEEEQQLNVYTSKQTDFSLSEHYVKGEIFEKIRKPLMVSQLRSIFVENVHGLNPISIYSLIDFRVGIEDILVEQSKRTDGEGLEVSALEGYFDAKNNMIREFNTNIDLEFKETIERKTPEEIKKHEALKRKKRAAGKLTKDSGPVPSQKVPMTPPDWNEPFSAPAQVDQTSHWFNFFFH
jgi:hypothetical protein